MGVALLLARALLAGVFAYAALAKAARIRQTRVTLQRFGVPTALVPAAAVTLPAFELALAIALIPTVTATPAAIAAALTLAVFSFAIGRALRAGDRAPCNCFGAQRRGRALGSPALARNGALGALAVWIAIAGPGDSVGQALAGAAPAIVIAAIAAVVVIGAQAWFSFELFRQNARLLDRVQRLERAQTQLQSPTTVAGPAPSSSREVNLRIAR